jgi:hypothetical protein
MKAAQRTQWLCDERPSRALAEVESRPARTVVLTPFSTRVPPELLERLRLAAPLLGLRQGEITAIALDRLLAKYGC